MAGSGQARRPTPLRQARRPALLFFASFAFTRRLETLFLALGAIFGALDQLAAHQLDHGLLGPIAFARSQADDAGVAAVALPEARAEGIEQLLDRFRGHQDGRGLPPRMQR